MEWRRFSDRYSVSNAGDVRDDANGRILGQWKSDQGYMLVRLSSPRMLYRVHRMVAAAFCENPKNFPCVNHIDSNRTNNNAENLEWCTQQQNLHHASALGRMQRDYWAGKRSPNAKLSDEIVERIRGQYASGGGSYASLAKMFCVSKRTIGKIVNNEHYQNLNQRRVRPPQEAGQ